MMTTILIFGIMLQMQIPKIFTHKYSNDFIALFAGAWLTLAFAPFNLFPLAFICPGLLLYTWLNTSPWRAFLRGWLFGFGLFSTGVYWIFISIHVYGNANIFLSVLFSIVLFAVLGLFPAVTGYYLNRFFPQTNAAKVLFAFPVMWVLSEWIRSWIFSGFAWLILGYSQLYTPLRGFASFYSVLGVSLVVLMTIGFCFEIYFEYKKRQKKRMLQHVLGLVLIWGVGIFASYQSWTIPNGVPLKLSLVQGNIPQEIKWSPNQIQPTLQKYKELTQAHWNSNLIIWPEGAIPLPLLSANDYIDEIADAATAHNVGLITGIPIKADYQPGYYNAVIGLGKAKGVYVKRRLVPFGEYTPVPAVFNVVMGSLDIPMADFVPGKGLHPPIEAFGTKIDTYICYEITFPEQVRNPDPDIGIILTVNNDAWFGKSFAQIQHFQMGQMRAIETGHPVIFVSNNGITGIIAANGSIQSMAPPFKEYVLSDLIQPRTGLTPWNRLGTDPLFFTLFGMLLRAFRIRKRTL